MDNINSYQANMSKLFRALLISVTATGVAAIVVSSILQKKSPPASPAQRREVDADALSADEIEQLTGELGDML